MNDFQEIFALSTSDGGRLSQFHRQGKDSTQESSFHRQRLVTEQADQLFRQTAPGRDQGSGTTAEIRVLQCGLVVESGPAPN